MNLRTLLFALVMALVFSGCRKSMSVLYGIKQPKIENHESLKGYLDKYNLPSDEIVVFKDSTGLIKIFRRGVVIPDAAFFNSDGYYIPYKNDSVDCNAAISPFIESLAKGVTYPVDSSFQMEYIFRELVNSKTQSVIDIVDLKGKYEYYVMFFWAAYTGKLNKIKVHDWYSVLEDPKNSGLNIRAYYVNVECQEFWGFTDKDLQKFKFSK